ncbi:hypothetical protein CMI41_04550 [Candidatus Pacearchaeota archaeon]|nr:hypothetical protein [Candidatus Pacearchaeota archaeon]|tara:strand:- start:12219 stop:12473 length:255 start_codon:yes stop_codon:yes gene_type:complete
MATQDLLGRCRHCTSPPKEGTLKSAEDRKVYSKFERGRETFHCGIGHEDCIELVMAQKIYDNKLKVTEALRIAKGLSRETGRYE